MRQNPLKQNLDELWNDMQIFVKSVVQLQSRFADLLLTQSFFSTNGESAARVEQ